MLIEKEKVLGDNLIHFYYLEPEEKAKETVVLLHGWGVSGEVFLPLADFLRKNSFRAYVLDFPGFGKSPIPKKALNLNDYLKIVRELIEKEIKEEVILVGHSFGGRVAIKFSALYPQLIKKLILIDSAGFVKRGFKIWLIRIFSKLFKPIFNLPIFSSLKIKIYKKLNTEDYLLNPELKETYKNIVKEDLKEFLPKITIPTLIIWGKEDKITPLSWGKRINKLISQSKFYEIKGGHFSFLDNAAECYLIIKNFLT